MGRLEISEVKKKVDPTSMPGINPIIGMNLSSSQTELVQSWGLGHFGRKLRPTLEDSPQSYTKSHFK
jgi:hypothetical protein